MEKRYQVFVSSTYQDLQEERQEVMHALLELDCIPSGMELFPAANESQWSLIKRVIADSDYYILILAGRYGSCGPEGISYTEMEYRYALSIDKPIIAFIHKDPEMISVKKCEATQEGKEKLLAFRALVEQKLCKKWANPSELGSVVSRSLIQLIKTTPAIGWVRADELPDKEATLELLKLRRQVEELQTELSHARTTAPKGSEDLAQGEELHFFKFIFESKDEEYNAKYWNCEIEITWNNIFGAVAPLMINEASDRSLKSALDNFVKTCSMPLLEQKKELKGQRMYTFSLNGDDFQTTKVQLRALGLITKSEKVRSVKDIQTYWTLTPYGDDMMTRLRAIRRNVAEAQVKMGKLKMKEKK
ncbi:MAG: DUF4062 domain-containing protein [Deltaproteobacteria bacterium]|nr:DUF4062 domain-containing protein [Deltaproteobacteria bacterium]